MKAITNTTPAASGSGENYDLCLDSAAIGLDNCVELIKKVIELKFDVKAK